MIASLLSVMTAMSVGQVHVVRAGMGETDRPIATPPLYPSGMVDAVHRPGFNGRLWVGRAIIGGREEPYPPSWASPGPEAYGAMDQAHAVIYARSGHLIVPLSPWVEIRPEGLRQLRRAQQFWLREQGFVGGVRTFVNDAYRPLPQDRAAVSPEKEEPSADVSVRPPSPPSAPGALPEPLMKFEIPADLPRARGRIRVDATRFSWPPATPAGVVLRTLQPLAGALAAP